MKLQHKAWALVLVTLGIAASGAVLGARQIVTDSFNQLEAQRAEREGERARRQLQQQLDSLGGTAKDYGRWLDAVHFVRGQKPSFLHENLHVGNMADLRLSYAVVLDVQGRTVASTRVHGTGMVPVPVTEIERLQPLAAAVLADPRSETVVQTYLANNGRIDMVAVGPIFDPAQAGQAPVGAMLMVRHFDETEVQRLSDALMVPVRLSLEVPADTSKASQAVPLDEEHEELHALVRDHLDRPLFQIVLTLDRELHQAGQSLGLTSMGLSALSGMFAAALLVLLLDRLLLRRLQRLHIDLKTITEQGPTRTGQVREQGNDELSQLGAGINALLDRVRTDTALQREAHERQEALQIQLIQSQKTEALGRLTGGIAHDFNNSLAAITGWVRLAAEDIPDPEHPSQEALQQALKATRYADGLMRQLLAFGRQTAPKLRRMHLTSLIEETRQMMASGLTRDCEIVVDYRVDDDEVDADTTQLQQVLVNLLINASDAMKGQGRIDLTLEEIVLPLPENQVLLPGTAGLAPGRYLLLRVRDHGPGIEPALLDRVFEPFFTTKAKGRGTGLGLSVAQGILARHLGGLGVQSEQGQGACFYFYLPVSQRKLDVAPITAPGGPGEGHHILFVDDDQLVRHAWSALLERKGWLVTRARDGEEAWTHFKQAGKRFDVVLTDQSMPRLDGVGLAHRIVASEEPPPIVLISGHVNEVHPDLREALFVAVLHKPVDTSEIDRVLRDVIRRHAEASCQA